MLVSVALLLSTQVHAWWGDENEATDSIKSNDSDHPAQMGRDFDENDLDNNQKKISAINVLLPISSCTECRKVKYELKATNGCYQW